MSLFKTRDLWSTSLDNDLFDLGCLKVANVSANKKNHCSIITGSYNGFLRIYNPTFGTDDSSSKTSQSSFRAHDLVCELALSAPIIQVETGKFVSTSKKEHIAVLLPKKLIIYEVVAYESGNVEHGNQYSLKFIYEHAQSRSSYNMCKGSFGGSEGNDYLCVQSMDGMLSIFEYESHSLTCFLPKCLIPGPFRYVPRTDSFVTVSSSWHLESYKYQSLALTSKFGSSSQSKNKEEDDMLSSSSGGKRIMPDYSYNMGEAALDIQVHGPHVLVLGERNLFCFTETCTLRFMKKFDYNPSAFCVYGSQSANSDSVQFLIATHSKLLYVHQDAKVKWAAQLEHAPVQACVARLKDLEGCIVTLCEDGKLKCSYLGTEPALLNPIVESGSDVANSGKSFDFGQAEAEYRRLQAQIKTAIVNTGSIFKSVGGANASPLQLSVNVPSKLDERSPMNMAAVRDTELRDPLDAIPSITVKVSLRANVEIAQNVKVTVLCSLPLVAVPDVFNYAQVGSIAYEQDVVFYMKTKHVPTSLEAVVCASYSVGAGGAVPRVSETRFSLPLKLVAKSGQQSSLSNNPNSSSSGNLANEASNNQNSKSIDSKLQTYSAKKITLESSRACVQLVDLFPEFASSYVPSNGNILAAQFYGHAQTNVSIQAAKSGANRYRLQSDSNSYEYLTLLTREFISRLDSHFAKTGGQVDLSFASEQLPTDELKLCIDRHLELRHTLIGYKEAIEKCCVQFRAIQKRLLIKFKDKSPTSLDNMDALLEATYRQIVTLSDTCITTQRELSLAAHALNSIASLYVVLVGLAFKLGKEGALVLEQIMTSRFGDTTDLGWEEIVSMSVTNMLKMALTKSSSKDQIQQQSLLLKIPEDSSKLEKQLKSFISKLQSGSSLVLDNYRPGESQSVITKNVSSSSFDEERKPKSNRNNRIDEDDESIKRSSERERERERRSKKEERIVTEESIGETKSSSRRLEKLEQPMRAKTDAPTFEELMESEEFKRKTKFNFESDDEND